MSQVNTMTSGAPVSICNAPTSAAMTSLRPPSRTPLSTVSTTHGSSPNAAMLFGHMSDCCIRPWKA